MRLSRRAAAVALPLFVVRPYRVSLLFKGAHAGPSVLVMSFGGDC